MKNDELVECACSPEEMEVIGRMRMAGGCDSDANLVRVALWKLAQHMDLLETPANAFQLRNPKTRQRPKKKHPWREYTKPKGAK